MEPSVPVEACVTRWNPADRVGAAVLSTGENVRFGATACKGFVPEVGMTVYVNGLRPHPLGGLAASVVRSEPLTEAEASERELARAQAATNEKMRPLVDIEGKLPSIDVDDKLGPTERALEHVFDPRTGELLRLLQLHRELAAAIGIEISNEPPWAFHDPSLWPFAIDGGGNVFAFHYHPSAVESGALLPVVFWDHEEHTHYFQAESLEAFLSGYLQRSIDHDPDATESCEALAHQLGVRASPALDDQLREASIDEFDWPLPTARHLGKIPLTSIQQRERTLVRELIAVSHAPPSQELVAPLAGLYAIYKELGWRHHLDRLHMQRIAWFAAQTRLLTRKR